MTTLNIMDAGMTTYTLGAYDTSISIPVPVITVDNRSSIGPLVVQESNSSFRLLVPVIENNQIKVTEIWYTFGTPGQNDLLATNLTVDVDILGLS
jgi:hypothetical protein